MCNDTDRECDSLLTIYKIYTDDIRNTKNNKWLVLYYSSLLQVGIYNYYYVDSDTAIKLWLFLSTCFISLSSSWLIMKYQDDIIRYRNKIDDRIKPNLDDLSSKSLEKHRGEYFEYFFDSFTIIYLLVLSIIPIFISYKIQPDGYIFTENMKGFGFINATSYAIIILHLVLLTIFLLIHLNGTDT